MCIDQLVIDSSLMPLSLTYCDQLLYQLLSVVMVVTEMHSTPYQLQTDLKKSSDSRLQLLGSFRSRMLDDVITCSSAGQPNACVICACVSIYCDLHTMMCWLAW